MSVFNKAVAERQLFQCERGNMPNEAKTQAFQKMTVVLSRQFLRADLWPAGRQAADIAAGKMKHATQKPKPALSMMAEFDRRPDHAFLSGL